MLNKGFQERLVVTERGGARHGAARLTPTGRAILALYRQMEKKSQAAAAPAWRRLQRLLS
jgi:molybdate transport system regulatory protein